MEENIEENSVVSEQVEDTQEYEPQIMIPNEDECEEDEATRVPKLQRVQRKMSIAESIRSSTSHTRFVFVQAHDLIECYAEKIQLYEQEVIRQQELMKKRDALVKQLRNKKLQIVRLEKQNADLHYQVEQMSLSLGE